jgi:PTH1 family peptidyl-tRNA hydrolase
MKLIVGLGNPGKQYENTRHNVGFIVACELAGDSEWKKSNSAKAMYTWINLDQKVELFLPQTFMNKSGLAVVKALKKHPKITGDDLYIIHDDLDIPLGKYKIQKGKGPKEHRGVKSVEEAIGFKGFWRVRIGVDNRTASNDEIPGEEYVLKQFILEEKTIIKEVINHVVEELKSKLEIRN